jgi:hypothetical protein
MGAMKLFVAAGVVVYLLMRPETKRYEIACWGWNSPPIRDEDRYYRGGVRLGPPLTLDLRSDDRGTIADIDAVRHDSP